MCGAVLWRRLAVFLSGLLLLFFWRGLLSGIIEFFVWWNFFVNYLRGEFFDLEIGLVSVSFAFASLICVLFFSSAHDYCSICRSIMLFCIVCLKVDLYVIWLFYM